MCWAEQQPGCSVLGVSVTVLGMHPEHLHPLMGLQAHHAHRQQLVGAQTHLQVLRHGRDWPKALHARQRCQLCICREPPSSHSNISPALGRVMHEARSPGHDCRPSPTGMVQEAGETTLSFHDSDFPALGGGASRAPAADLPRRGSAHESLANGESSDRGQQVSAGVSTATVVHNSQ